MRKQFILKRDCYSEGEENISDFSFKNGRSAICHGAISRLAPEVTNEEFIKVTISNQAFKGSKMIQMKYGFAYDEYQYYNRNSGIWYDLYETTSKWLIVLFGKKLSQLFLKIEPHKGGFSKDED